MSGGGPDDPRFVALVDVVRRTGCSEFQIRYSDDERPVVWMAVAGYRMHNGRPRSKGKINHYEAAAAMSPLRACYRLAEQLMDGGECAHCGRPSGVSDDWSATMPLDELICWYVYDPELEKFRRSCEGET